MALSDLIIGAESGGNPNATNPNSSASGLGQFINSTWLSTIKTARPDLAQGKSDAELLALKSDPDLSRQMTEAYAAQNQGILQKNGLPVTPGNTYLAHFAGPQGAVSVLQADPTASAASILGPAVVKANPFLANMTAADLRAWADKKMGSNAPSQPQPAPASPVPPANGLLAARAGGLMQSPVFPQPAPMGLGAPQQSAQADPGYFAQIPAETMQAPPIFFAPRRSPDLRSLKAALGNGGVFFSRKA